MGPVHRRRRRRPVGETPEERDARLGKKEGAPPADPEYLPPIKGNQVTAREKALVGNLVSGMKKPAAARAAGLTRKQAYGQFGVINRPAVRSFMTEALITAGLSPRQIIQPIIDALGATKTYIDKDAGLMSSNQPDHAIRLHAHELTRDMFGLDTKKNDPLPPPPALEVNIEIINQVRESMSEVNSVKDGGEIEVSFSTEEVIRQK